MKKIIISLTLSAVCLMVTFGSFLTNDLAAYRDWTYENHPRMADTLDRHLPGFSQETPPGRWDDRRHGSPHRMDRARCMDDRGAYPENNG